MTLYNWRLEVSSQALIPSLMVFGFFSRKQAGPAQAATGTSPTPTPPPPDPSPSPSPDEVVTDPTKLHALIASVPAQTFHAYALLHLSPSPQSPFPILSTPALLGQEKPLDPPSSQTLTVLSAFFSALKPPPKLHCVRCHNGFFELENGDTSCRVQHDDESAIVDRVKTGYETLWGCCGRTVEGDGDMGPPDGWCYEGRHTVRFSYSNLSLKHVLMDLPSNFRLTRNVQGSAWTPRLSMTSLLRVRL